VEITDYLRRARKRWWILVAVPVLAAGATIGIALLHPATYTATAYVAAPALVGGVAGQQYSGTQAANQFVAAFSAAATTPKVLTQVTKDTGLSAETLRAGISVSQVGASSQLELDYTSTDRDTVAPVLTSISRRALIFLFASQVDVATEQVTVADGDMTAATKAITDWEAKNKLSQPDKVYQATLSGQGSLQQQQLSMAAVGNTGGAAAAGKALAQSQKLLDEIGPKLPDYQALLAQRDAATSAVADARRALLAARAQRQAAEPNQVTSVGAVVATSRTHTLVTTVPPVTAAALLLAVLLLPVLELIRRRPEPMPAT
jgi:uncharacterized protein involved in exopolysaccharide biosynthesis